MVTIGRLVVMCAGNAAVLGNGPCGVDFARFAVIQKCIEYASRVNLESALLV